jgi:hypothetical protein
MAPHRQRSALDRGNLCWWSSSVLRRRSLRSSSTNDVLAKITSTGQRAGRAGRFCGWSPRAGEITFTQPVSGLGDSTNRSMISAATIWACTAVRSAPIGLSSSSTRNMLPESLEVSVSMVIFKAPSSARRASGEHFYAASGRRK